MIRTETKTMEFQTTENGLEIEIGSVMHWSALTLAGKRNCGNAEEKYITIEITGPRRQDFAKLLCAPRLLGELLQALSRAEEMLPDLLLHTGSEFRGQCGGNSNNSASQAAGNAEHLFAVRANDEPGAG